MTHSNWKSSPWRRGYFYILCYRVKVTPCLLAYLRIRVTFAFYPWENVLKSVARRARPWPHSQICQETIGWIYVLSELSRNMNYLLICRIAGNYIYKLIALTDWNKTKISPLRKLKTGLRGNWEGRHPIYLVWFQVRFQSWGEFQP